MNLSRTSTILIRLIDNKPNQSIKNDFNHVEHQLYRNKTRGLWYKAYADAIARYNIVCFWRVGYALL